MKHKFSRVNQSYALVDILFHSNSCSLLDLPKNIQINLLEEAINEAISIHPKASSIISEDFFNFHWEYKIMNHPLKRLVLGDKDLKQLISDNIKHKSLFRHGKIFEFILIEQEDKYTLQALFSHVFADGKSADIINKTIIDIYRNKVDKKQYSLKVIEPQSWQDKGRFLKDHSFFQKFSLAMMAFYDFLKDTFTPAGQIHFSGKRTDDVTFDTLFVGDGMLKKLKQLSKKLNVSMHSFFLAALATSCKEFNQTKGKGLKSIRIIDNFSLRRFSSDPAVDGFFDCAAVPYTLDLKTTIDRDNIESLNKEIVKLKKGKILKEIYRLGIYLKLSYTLPKKIAVKIAVTLFHRTDIAFTNVGIIDPGLETLDGHELSYKSFPALFYPCKVLLMATSYKNELRLIFVYDKGLFKIENEEKILVDNFIKNLKLIVKTHG